MTALAACRAVAALLALALIAACATPPPDDDPEAVAEWKALNDPLEPANRALFAFNNVVDTVVLKPAAKTYVKVVPLGPRLLVRNLLGVLGEPVNMANSLLQGQPKRAGISFLRLVANVTLGFFGVFDIATEMGLKRQNEDFGQTLAVWGMPSGPYLMLPVLGPSSPRDFAGTAVDYFLDPYNMWSGLGGPWQASQARTAGSAVNERAQVLDSLDEIRRTSVDYYATIRSMHWQRRDAMIHNSDTAIASPAVGLR